MNKGGRTASDENRTHQHGKDSGVPVRRGKVVNAFIAATDPALDRLTEELIGEKTARKKAEKQLERQEATSARLPLIISWMLHDLRTPLTGVMGYASLIGDAVFGRLGDGAPNAEQLALRIEGNGTRMLEALDMARDYMKFAAGRLEIKKERADLGDGAAKAVEIMRQRAEDKKLILQLSRPVLTCAEVDQQLLKHVLISLIKSSIICTPKDGRIAVSVGTTDGLATISVSDTGRAITKEEMAFALNPGESAGSIRAVECRGLGFVVAKAFVESMGGRVGVESGDTGTTFSVVFPAAATDLNTSLHK